MKTRKIKLTYFRNAEHFQLMTEVKDLINRFGAEALKILKLFLIFMKWYDVEDECQVIVKKSEYGEKISKADSRRDTTFRGLRDAINSAQNHFNEEIVDAAKRLKNLLNAYGNLSLKPVDEETSGIFNLIQDMEGKYAADVETIGLGAWTAELKRNNEEYESLVKSRDAESADKPDAKMTEVRGEVDEAYRNMTGAVEALGLLAEGEEAETYESFIRELNVILDRYANRLAQREGKNAAKKEEEEKKKEEEDDENGDDEDK